MNENTIGKEVVGAAVQEDAGASKKLWAGLFSVVRVGSFVLFVFPDESI